MTYAKLTAQNRDLYAKAEHLTGKMAMYHERSPEWASLFIERRNLLLQIEKNLDEVFRKLNIERNGYSIGAAKIKNAKIYRRWVEDKYPPLHVVGLTMNCSAQVASRAISHHLKAGRI